MQTILLTGATGEVGSQLALKLKAEGHTVVCLVRSTDDESAQERVNAKLGPDFTAVEGDIHLELCGLSAEDISVLKGKVSKIVHSAALVKFNESLREKTFHTNYDGTKHAIELAKTLDSSEFHYISTADVAGGVDNFGEEDIGLKENARNPYEESKQAAEGLVRASELPYSIYRLGVVVGHSETGETDTYNGFYGYFSTSWHMREKMLEEAKDVNFQIPVNLNCTINLIQRNWVQDVLLKLISKQANNYCFHITHPKPPTVGWVLGTCYPFLELPIEAVMEYGEPQGASRYWHVIQRGILREVATYHAYTDREAKFSNDVLRATLGDDYQDPKPMIKEQIYILLDYAQRTAFGKQNLDEPELVVF